ncbi:hypothetical protein Q4I32_008254 [Leishmania shawi]|uniref:Uncharacterized protein n=1 Tax=Leishmania shawi TaxID=5680 RepID=A0AAW3B7F8_9TRYP
MAASHLSRYMRVSYLVTSPMTWKKVEYEDWAHFYPDNNGGLTQAPWREKCERCEQGLASTAGMACDIQSIQGSVKDE